MLWYGFWVNHPLRGRTINEDETGDGCDMLWLAMVSWSCRCTNRDGLLESRRRLDETHRDMVGASIQLSD